MGASLVERNSVAKQYFVRASEVLGYDLLDLCQNGPEERLNATNFSQPALFVHSVAALSELLSQHPDLMSSVEAFAGLSLVNTALLPLPVAFPSKMGSAWCKSVAKPCKKLRQLKRAGWQASLDWT